MFPGGEKRKIAMTPVIWQNTVVNMQWNRGHLSMGSAANPCQNP